MVNKNLLFLIVGVGLIAVLVFFYFGGDLKTIASVFTKPKTDLTGIILFYGDGCPHCEKVEEYIRANNIEEKIKFTRLRILIGAEKGNKEMLKNSQIFLEKALSCGINTQEVGVPFLWDGKNCILGDKDVIKFFAEKI